VDRRLFLMNSTIALTSLTSAEVALAATKQQDGRLTGQHRAAGSGGEHRLPARTSTVTGRADWVDQEGARGVDLIALPETFRGQNERSLETLDGPTITALAPLARKHRTYIVAPIDRKDADRRFNSAVVLDRQGKIAGIYDKIYPYWVEEFPRRPTVQPGQTVTVIPTDFGRLGLAICYDVNWALLWQRLSDFGAELVIWPSAYSAGKTLQARAIDFSYYITERHAYPRLPGVRYRWQATSARNSQLRRL
jgi:hypothetical protein